MPASLKDGRTPVTPQNAGLLQTRETKWEKGKRTGCEAKLEMCANLIPADRLLGPRDNDTVENREERKRQDHEHLFEKVKEGSGGTKVEREKAVG